MIHSKTHYNSLQALVTKHRMKPPITLIVCSQDLIIEKKISSLGQYTGTVQYNLVTVNTFIMNSCLPI